MKKTLRNMMKRTGLVIAILCMTTVSMALAKNWKAQPDPKATGTIDLKELSGTGTRILNGFSHETDGEKWGLLKTYEIILPDSSQGLFFAHATKAKAWPNMRNQGYPYFATKGNKKSLANLRDGIIYFILPLNDGSYLAVTSMPGPKTQSWFHTDKDGRFLLSVGTFGTKGVKNCDTPLFAWARSRDVYEACNKVINSAITSKPLKGWTQLRYKKEYKEYFKYLGWCSWEHFKGRITEETMLGAIDDIEASVVPVRYVIIDMGHTDNKGGGMISFKPRLKKFPNGWAPILKRRKPDKIKWMCLWHFFNGSNNGIHVDNDFGPEVNKYLVPLAGKKNSLTIRNDPKAARGFYRAFIGSVKDYGFDFLKVDFQSAQLRRLAGKVENGAEMCVNNSQAFDATLHELDLGLINCNWHNPVNFFNCRYSSVGRCSMDYVKHSLFSGRRHLFQSYANTLWIGQLVWPDHDMFHSSDNVAGTIMAISKAFSGGPVYLSDDPKDFDPEAVKPVCYKDGRILRPLAPGAPLPDSIFANPYAVNAPYRVIVPLSNDSAAVVAYNFRSKGKREIDISGKFSPNDYIHASAMIQPYPGKWKMPAEGLVIYDWYGGKGWKFDSDFTFELKGFADRLALLCPVRNGWAVIGRSDKYLSASAVEIISTSDRELKLKMIEAGPLAIWSHTGKPKASGLTFVDAGKGLYKADMPIGKKNVVVTITR